MNDRILTLNLPPVIESVVIDTLLASEHCEGFSTSRIDGHSVNSTHYTLTEQVTGRQKRIEIQVLCDEFRSTAILEELKTYSGAGIHYWLTPLILEGQLV